MSVQFGRWNFDGKPVEQDYLDKVHPVLLPFGPDDRASLSKGAISMLYYGFHTTRESRCEKQPLVMASGAIITWDGRLDNRAELIRQLGNIVTLESTDVSIVAAAYERWGGGCFAQLIGDWALAIWDPRERALTLAKDPIGVRHLYYSFDGNQVTWSTVLDPLILFAGKRFAFCEEYIAGWFSYFPAAHLTPYAGIHSVAPSSYVVVQPGKHTVTKYWDFDPDKQIRYHTDGEYEEHFRVAFGAAVRRRLRSDSPLLAELSGGMDSTSIVCMADIFIDCGDAEATRLDTISYYDDSEPNWNERPYFTKVEEKRGRKGIHINVSSNGQVKREVNNPHFMATPASVSYASSAINRPMDSHAYRVVLSGTGGDEVTGGVPTPIPEIADLLTSGQVARLARQLKAWALNKRQPWFYLLFETAKQFMPSFARAANSPKPAPWLQPRFVKRNREALQGYEERWNFFGPRPTFQENMMTIHALQRQLGCAALSTEPLLEKRYPYLDRSLIEFLYAVPRDQLVRPGQRRFLMRRALNGIVPDEILHRKRKAFAVRSPINALVTEYNHQVGICTQLESGSLGIVSQDVLQKTVNDVVCGREVPIVPLMRTIGIEIWLRSIGSLEASTRAAQRN